MAALAEEGRFAGQPAVELHAGPVRAVFLPDVGMTGVSLRFGGRERLALPGGVRRLRSGGTAGLPLLAPWANRLATRRFRVADGNVDLEHSEVPTDDNGLPIHGLVLGTPDWQVTRLEVKGPTARLGATLAVDRADFPFPHRIDLSVTARDDGLVVDTSITPTGHRAVPIGFGWHPYLRLPGVPRDRWTLRLPARRHLDLDRRGLPTGAEEPEPAEEAALGRRRLDDLYALDRDKRLWLASDDGQRIELRGDTGYPWAQVWVPPRRPYAALEPMTAPTNSLVAGTAPMVQPGDRYTARFTLSGA